MADTLFYTKNPDLDLIELSPEESHHAIKVSRLTDGDSIQLTDGQGRILDGLVRLEKKTCWVEVISRKQLNRQSSQLQLAFPALKSNDRFTLVLEKAVELGIHTLHLFTCKNSAKRLPNRDKVMRKLIAGLKQSKTAYLPEVVFHNSLEDVTTFITASQQPPSIYAAHCQPSNNKKLLNTIAFPAVVLIGPEADFSVKEMEALVSKGVIELHLGPNRLRAETAALLTMSYAYQIELGNIAS